MLGAGTHLQASPSFRFLSQSDHQLEMMSAHGRRPWFLAEKIAVDYWGRVSAYSFLRFLPRSDRQIETISTHERSC